MANGSVRLLIPCKLVRDKIVDRIQQQDGRCLVGELKGKAYRKALLEKLVEEAEEVRDAKTQDERNAELADLMEVLLVLQAAFGISPLELDTIRKRKAALLGSFAKGIKLYAAWGGRRSD